MKNKKIIIFDFDGTLFNSKIGIINAVKFTLANEGIEENNQSILESFIGPPLYASFQKHYGFSDEKVKDVVIKFREYYSTKGYKETALYEGIKELLVDLKTIGKTLAIATAKPTIFAKQILEIYELSHFFSSIQGSRSKGELFPKDRIIGTVLEELNIFDNAECVMIGDTIYDIKGAEEHGIQTIGVSYGYGKLKDLKDARATKIIHSVKELKTLLLG